MSEESDRGREYVADADGWPLHKRIAWAMGFRGLKPSERLVLIALALRARRDDDYEAWPSLKRLSADCQLSKSSAIRALRRLLSVGAIRETYRKRGRGGVVAYSLNRETKGVELTPFSNAEKVSKTTGKGVKIAPYARAVRFEQAREQVREQDPIPVSGQTAIGLCAAGHGQDDKLPRIGPAIDEATLSRLNERIEGTRAGGRVVRVSEL